MDIRTYICFVCCLRQVNKRQIEKDYLGKITSYIWMLKADVQGSFSSWLDKGGLEKCCADNLSLDNPLNIVSFRNFAKLRNNPAAAMSPRSHMQQAGGGGDGRGRPKDSRQIWFPRCNCHVGSRS